MADNTNKVEMSPMPNRFDYFRCLAEQSPVSSSLREWQLFLDLALELGFLEISSDGVYLAQAANG